ncbi:MAG: flippase-like domain-containing protein [Acidimicrobiia bacterium]|nr:flippase-like domain-containing protein [Acidimicrobiia bacterium]MBV9041880.1 flippase-like domain-containing protein [Acidimicrobiia bacterium]
MRLVVALALLALMALFARSGNVSASEADAFRLFNDLPRIFTGIALPMLVIGSPVAIGGVAIAALFQRRWRLAIELVVAGGAGYGVARLLQHVIARPGPAAHILQFHHVAQLVVSDRVTLGTGFPSAALAVSAALATAAGPHVRRPVGRTAWGLVVGVALARMYAGLDLPLDVVAGVAVGWGVGAALNLVLGAPSGHPSRAQVHDALADAGIEVVSLVPSGMGGRSYARFLAKTDAGEELFVKVLGSEERSADLLMRVWRFVAFRGVQDELAFVSRKRSAEHEALLAITAAQAGVRVPHIRLAARGRRGEVFLVEERVRGHTLDDIPVESIDDKVLERVWEQVACLHAARIAHRDLRRHNVLVDEAGEPWLLDFNLAEAASSPRRLHRDVCELLVSLTAVVGPQRAADSAIEALGSDEVLAAMPMLQPLAISGRTLSELPGRQGVIAELRNRVADRLDIEHEPLAQITRVRPRTLIALAAFGFAVQLLLPQVGEFSQTVDAVTSAHWAWMLAAAAAAAATFVAAGLAQRGAVAKRLPLYPMTIVQVACSFVNRVTPAGTGGLGLNERHLEKSGLSRTASLSAIGLNALAGAVVHALGVAIAIAALGQSGIGGTPLPRGWGVLVAVTVGFAIAGIVLLSPLRRRIAGPARRAASDLVHVLRKPVQAVQLFSGNIGVTLGNALALAACLAAFHANADLLKVIVVYLGGSAVASVSPTPGALGAVEAALVAGLTGVGVAAGPAVAGVLSFRLVTFWLPTLPGFFAFRVVRRNQWA